MTQKYKSGIGDNDDLKTIIKSDDIELPFDVEVFLTGEKEVNKTVYPGLLATYNLVVEGNRKIPNHPDIPYNIDVYAYPNFKLHYYIKSVDPITNHDIDHYPSVGYIEDSVFKLEGNKQLLDLNNINLVTKVLAFNYTYKVLLDKTDNTSMNEVYSSWTQFDLTPDSETTKANWQYDSINDYIYNLNNQGGISGYYNPNDINKRNYTIDVEMMTDNADDDMMGFAFRFQDPNNFYSFEWDNGDSNSGVFSSLDGNGAYLFKYVNGVRTKLAYFAQTWTRNTWENIKINVVDNTFEIYHNGTLILSATDDTFDTGAYGPISMSQPSTYFGGLVVSNQSVILDGPSGFKYFQETDADFTISTQTYAEIMQPHYDSYVAENPGTYQVTKYYVEHDNPNINFNESVDGNAVPQVEFPPQDYEYNVEIKAYPRLQVDYVVQAIDTQGQVIDSHTGSTSISKLDGVVDLGTIDSFNLSTGWPGGTSPGAYYDVKLFQYPRFKVEYQLDAIDPSSGEIVDTIIGTSSISNLDGERYIDINTTGITTSLGQAYNFYYTPIAVLDLSTPTSVNMANLENPPTAGSTTGWVCWGDIDLNWTESGGVLTETFGGRGGIYYEYNYNDTNMPKNFRFKMEAKAPADALDGAGIGVTFRSSYTLNEHRYKLWINNTGTWLYYEDGIDAYQLKANSSFTYTKGQWHTIEVSCYEEHIVISVDGQVIIDFTDTIIAAGHFGPYTFDCPGAQFRNFSYTLDPVEVQGNTLAGSILKTETTKQLSTETYQTIMDPYITEWKNNNGNPTISGIVYYSKTDNEYISCNETSNGSDYIIGYKIAEPADTEYVDIKPDYQITNLSPDEGKQDPFVNIELWITNTTEPKIGIHTDCWKSHVFNDLFTTENPARFELPASDYANCTLVRDDSAAYPEKLTWAALVYDPNITINEMSWESTQRITGIPNITVDHIGTTKHTINGDTSNDVLLLEVTLEQPPSIQEYRVIDKSPRTTDGFNDIQLAFENGLQTTTDSLSSLLLSTELDAEYYHQGIVNEADDPVEVVITVPSYSSTHLAQDNSKTYPDKYTFQAINHMDTTTEISWLYGDNTVIPITTNHHTVNGAGSDDILLINYNGPRPSTYFNNCDIIAVNESPYLNYPEYKTPEISIFWESNTGEATQNKTDRLIASSGFEIITNYTGTVSYPSEEKLQLPIIKDVYSTIEEVTVSDNADPDLAPYKVHFVISNNSGADIVVDLDHSEDLTTTYHFLNGALTPEGDNDIDRISIISTATNYSIEPWASPVKEFTAELNGNTFELLKKDYKAHIEFEPIDLNTYQQKFSLISENGIIYNRTIQFPEDIDVTSLKYKFSIPANGVVLKDNPSTVVSDCSLAFNIYESDPQIIDMNYNPNDLTISSNYTEVRAIRYPWMSEVSLTNDNFNNECIVSFDKDWEAEIVKTDLNSLFAIPDNVYPHSKNGEFGLHINCDSENIQFFVVDKDNYFKLIAKIGELNPWNPYIHSGYFYMSQNNNIPEEYFLYAEPGLMQFNQVIANEKYYFEEIPQQNSPVIATNQDGIHLRRVFFMDSDGNLTLANYEEVIVKDNIIRLTYRDITVEEIIDQEGNIVPYTEIQNNLVILPGSSLSGQSVKVKYHLNNSFYMDYINKEIAFSEDHDFVNVIYEQNKYTPYYLAKKIDLNPCKNDIENGFLYIGPRNVEPKKLEVTISPEKITTQQKANIKVKIVDMFNNPVISQTDNVSIVASHGTITFQNNNQKPDIFGNVYADYTYAGTAITDTITITITYKDLTVEKEIEVYEYSDEDYSLFVEVENNKEIIFDNDNTILKAMVYDKNFNPIAGETVQFSINDTIQNTVTDAEGCAYFIYEPTPVSNLSRIDQIFVDVIDKGLTILKNITVLKS